MLVAVSTPPDPVIIIGGGQSGLNTARAALEAGLRPVVLESGPRAVGSWPHYYDSLTLFSPVKYSSFPGAPFPGEPDEYPARDAVIAYLDSYARDLDVEIRTDTRVSAVTSSRKGGFQVHTEAGEEIAASGVVAASGSFANPYRPQVPGQDHFAGAVLHVAEYRNAQPYAGKRIVVVGAGNSAVQVAYELSGRASVTLATRAPVHFVAQRRLGKDLHYWLKTTRLDVLPRAWLVRIFTSTPVLDTGIYRDALASGQLDRRPMFTRFDGDDVVWPDGSREKVDVVIYATGYRPNLGYLEGLGALDQTGMPRHHGGISTTHAGLVYAGLEFQRSFSSNTLRGVHRDAKYVVEPLAAHVNNTTRVVSSGGAVPGPAG
ncbi:NAD(P)/FAD-dependent oxidoreductase [Phytoactinopolyspora alkaliphila]|uniref:NAD(P)/FAD-dependent oxidoreductase n=1 Tax=Phytoactinopolyspora alkaliphila TaxID=1783498 RepID=A0A6N9YGX6_9ACTN|nr:NAD(P)-binding domain-containing protein [Phytoactinopolyspora alkaliphila]NED94301.1 NAD(P)/FAD-dependent oxidoreductase [Phytoactinopolyspora alkaliphila]